MGLTSGGLRSNPGRLPGLALSSGVLKYPELASQVSTSNGSFGRTVRSASSRQSKANFRARSRGMRCMSDPAPLGEEFAGVGKIRQQVVRAAGDQLVPAVPAGLHHHGFRPDRAGTL